MRTKLTTYSSVSYDIIALCKINSKDGKGLGQGSPGTGKRNGHACQTRNAGKRNDYLKWKVGILTCCSAGKLSKVEVADPTS